MNLNSVNAAPGIGTVRTFTPKEIFWTRDGAQFIPGGKPISGADSRDSSNTSAIATLQPGLLMGKISSSSKYAPAILGTVATAYTASATTLTVTVATAVELVRRIGATGTFVMVGPPSAAGTVATTGVTYSAVSQTTGAVTITAVTAANYIAGSFIQPNDGSNTILGVLDDFVRVTDADGNALDVQGSRIACAGPLVASKIINYPSDSSLKTWLKLQLNLVSTGVGPGPFLFDDNF